MVFDLSVMVVAAVAGGLLARTVRLPSILGFIAGGLLLGPTLNVVHDDVLLEGSAELGVAFLLFFVGLELSIGEVRSLGRTALIAGSVQMGVTFALGTGIAYALGLPLGPALLAGTAVTFSSTVVTVKLLSETGGLSATFGRAALGILLVQDLAVMLVLAVVTGLAGGASGPLAAGLEVGEALLEILALLAVTLLSARYVLPRFFRWVTGSEEAFFLSSIGWLFLFVVVAIRLGLTLEAGAFLAGVGLAQLPYSQELRRRVSPLLTFFLALFFLRTGLEVDFAFLLEQWALITALAAFSFFGKPLLLAAILPRAGLPGRDAVRAAVSLGTVSEFGFILAALAASLGLVEASLAGALTLVALITMVAGSPVLAWNGPIADRLLRVAAVERLVAARGKGREREENGKEKKEAEEEARMKDHVVLVGWNPIAEDVLDRLVRQGIAVALVTSQPLHGHEPTGCERVVYGNPDHPEVLEEACFREARMVVSTLPEPGLNRHLLEICRDVTPFAARAETRELARALELAGAAFAVVPTHVAAEALLARTEGVDRQGDGA